MNLNDARIIELEQAEKRAKEDETRFRRMGWGDDVYLEFREKNCISVVTGSCGRYGVAIIETSGNASMREEVEDISDLREAIDLALDFDPRDVRLIREEREYRRSGK